jgi:hypothetical protein
VVGWLLCGFYAVILFIQEVMILFQMSRKNLVVNMNTEISRLALKIVVMGNREQGTLNWEQGTGNS